MTIATQPPRSRPHHQQPFGKNLSVTLPAVVGLAVILFFLALPRPSTPPTNTTKPPTVIPSADAIQLSADVTWPTGTGPCPAVILIHDFAQDHHQWDPFVQDFIRAGFVVVAYDGRGFGESRLATVPTDQAAWENAMPNDVAAVVAYLKEQSRVDVNRINVVGAGLGANIAYVASGSQLGIHRAVLLSPHLTPGVLDGAKVKDFSPTGILGVAGTTEKSNLDAVMSRVKSKHERLDVDGGSLGVSLLTNEQTLTSVLTWLQG